MGRSRFRGFPPTPTPTHPPTGRRVSFRSFSLINIRSFRCVFVAFSFPFVSFRLLSFPVVSVRFLSFRFLSFRAVPFLFFRFRFVSFRSVSCGVVWCRFVSFLYFRSLPFPFVAFRCLSWPFGFFPFRSFSHFFVPFRSFSFGVVSFRLVLSRLTYVLLTVQFSQPSLQAQARALLLRHHLLDLMEDR